MARSLISKYLNQLRKGEESEVDFGELGVDVQDPLEAYRECQEKGGLIEARFEAGPDGNLYAHRDGVTVILEKDVLAEDLDYYRPRIKDKFVDVDFTVRIVRIDEAERKVYVRSSRSSAASSRRRLIAEIQDELGKGNMPHIMGKVDKVEPNRVRVDILCKGILGFCNVDKWQKGFIRYLDADCSEGEIYDFSITGQLKERPGKPPAFKLSRIPFTKDPWEEIPEYVAPGAVLAITCIDMPHGKTFWWGKSASVSGIEIMCDYNDKIHLAKGGSYRCKVTDCDREKHVLKAVPFAVAGGNRTNDETIKFINGRGSSGRSRR